MDIEKILTLIENHGLTLIALVVLVGWLRPKVDDMWAAIMKLAARPEQPLPVPEDSL